MMQHITTETQLCTQRQHTKSNVTFIKYASTRNYRQLHGQRHLQEFTKIARATTKTAATVKTPTTIARDSTRRALARSRAHERFTNTNKYLDERDVALAIRQVSSEVRQTPLTARPSCTHQKQPRDRDRTLKRLGAFRHHNSLRCYPRTNAGGNEKTKTKSKNHTSSVSLTITTLPLAGEIPLSHFRGAYSTSTKKKKKLPC